VCYHVRVLEFYPVGRRSDHACGRKASDLAESHLEWQPASTDTNGLIPLQGAALVSLQTGVPKAHAACCARNELLSTFLNVLDSRGTPRCVVDVRGMKNQPGPPQVMYIFCSCLPDGAAGWALDAKENLYIHGRDKDKQESRRKCHDEHGIYYIRTVVEELIDYSRSSKKS
jgi:hypothetical protein